MRWVPDPRRVKARLRSLWSTAAGRPAAHLDEPRESIELSAVYVRGWAVGASDADVTLTLNGIRRPVAFYPRPDVERVFEGQLARGFSTFARLEELGHPSSVVVDVTGPAGVMLSRTFPVGEAARAAAMEEQAIRQHHREWLAGRFVCIRCNAQLVAATWRCAGCGHDYGSADVLNGLPPELEAAPELAFAGGVCSHGYDGDVERIIAGVEQIGGMTLDCGAGWRQRIRRSVITTEIYAYPSTDVLAVSQRLPFVDGAFDAVLSLHVLEHVPDPFASARELLRVLKPGGTLLAVTPMIVPEHGFPHHYFNPTREGLVRLFGADGEGARVFVPAIGHPINGVHSVLSAYAEGLREPDRRQFMNLRVRDLLGTSIEGWLAADIAVGLSEESRRRLAANFCIELVKKRDLTG
jgi:SAM-dependent methyltransferase